MSKNCFKSLCVLCFFMSGYSNPVNSQTQIAVTPSPGTALRKTLLDTIRPRIEAEVKSPVRFVIQAISVTGDTAIICAIPQYLDGSKIDPSKTILKEVFDNDDVDGPATSIEGTNSHLKRVDGVWYEIAWQGGPNVCEIK